MDRTPANQIGLIAENMQTTLGCRAQSTVWRKRLTRSLLGGLFAFWCVYVGVGTDKGLTEPLSSWSGPVPPLSLVTLDGDRVSVGEPRNRLVIVHFFATWCENCGPELKALDRLRTDLSDRVMIVGVDVGEPDVRIRRYFEKSPVGFPIGLDADRTTARAWGVFALPSTFVLDRSLAPLLKASGDVDWDDAAIRALLIETRGSHPASANRSTAPQTAIRRERTTP